ncbi:MAG: hypothetical protein P8R42_06230 [Candidatus Binatia bacterium]|nr:hypothetical protein [Candidatus Binatia bacterium]
MRKLVTMTVAVAILAGGFPSPCLADLQEKAAVGFEALYPSGTEYEVAVAAVNGLLLVDGDGDGLTNDDRCDDDGEAEIAEAMAGLNILAATAPLCDAIPDASPVGDAANIACNVVQAVTALAIQSVAIYAMQCGFQGSNVDGAEIEAAFENTRLIHSAEIEALLLDDCRQVVGLYLPEAFGGRAEQVRDLVQVRIRQAADAGGFASEVEDAQDELSAGNNQLAAKNYRSAYKRYCDAYKTLVGFFGTLPAPVPAS